MKELKADLIYQLTTSLSEDEREILFRLLKSDISTARKIKNSDNHELIMTNDKSRAYILNTVFGIPKKYF